MNAKANSNLKSLLIPFLITLVGALLMLVVLFLPFAAADEEHKEKLLEYADEDYIEEIDMTNEDAVNISLVEFVKIYAEAAKQDVQKSTCIATIVVIVIFAVFELITALMSVLKKPIGIIIFNVLGLVTFKLIQFDFEDRGVIPSRTYDSGIANYLAYIIGVIIIAGAVWLFIEKHRAKKSVEAE